MNSVLNQTLNNLEVIIIDDGSSDNSGAIAQKYAEKHNFQYFYQENKGVSSARNAGLKKASGEYIAFLDADDFLEKNAYGKLYKLAKEHDSDTVIGNITCVSENRVWTLSYMKKIFNRKLPKVRHICINPELNLSPSVSNKLYKNSLLKKNNIQFDEDIYIGEDLLFTQKSLYLSNKTIVTDTNTLNYRVDEESESLSNKANINFFRQLVKLQRKITNLYSELNLTNFIKTIEERQLNYYFDSIFLKGKFLNESSIELLMGYSKEFIKLVNDSTLEKSFTNNIEKKFLLELIINNNIEDFIKLLQRFRKKNQVKPFIYEDARVFHWLYKEFSHYRDMLEVKKMEIVHQIEVIKLRGSVLTLGGYAFITGISNDRVKKEIIFKNNKSEKKIVLQNTLRTDITYQFAKNVIDYNQAGFETVNLDLIELPGLGQWETYIRLTVDNLIVESPINVVLAQLRNNAKMTITDNIEISTHYKNGKELTLQIKDVTTVEIITKKLNQLKKNIRFDLSFLKSGDYHTFLAIIIYKCFGGLLKMRDIWLIGERSDTAQDNSYHLFKYIRKTYENISAYYVIDKKSSDYQAIKQLGNIVQFGGLKHTLFLLTCKKTINSYSEKSNMYTESYKKIMKYYPHWQQNEKVFLQHGVIGVSRVNHVLHKNRMDYSLFLVSSQFEKEHIIKEFGYKEDEVEVTGLARWDALQDISRGKEILLMPTWRSWIKTSDQLINSKYYRSYISLLKNNDLHNILEERDLTLTFYPHYQIQKLLGNLPAFHPRIKVIKQGEETVQSLLKKHSILITDYSTVSFDFAYMKKNVIFYQFDYDDFYSEHYNEGPINHRKDLFGERVETEEEVINTLKNIKHIKQDNRIDRYIYKDREGISHTNKILKKLTGGN